MQEQQQIQFTQRDDILHFSHALSNSIHNVKNIQDHRKKHNENKKKYEDQFPYSTQITTNQYAFVNTLDSSIRHNDILSAEKMRINLDSFSQKRHSFTTGTSRKKSLDAGIKNASRTLHLPHNINTRQNIKVSKKMEPKENKFAEIEKKYNKGPIKDKYVTSWLNSILMEACFQQKFDITIENPALKKYGIDENSLKSKGIHSQNLIRIYKSLFVYSIGFNNLLNEICGQSMSLRKTLWKVFAILLEYCSQGSFETMLAQIERDKLQKIEGLISQIKKRQKIIQANEQINESKNDRIYKEIRKLRQQNDNLVSDKQVLMDEYKQAEQAFNNEVGLRLRFENKINEIHGVYSQIQRKHQRLRVDHSEAEQSISKMEKQIQKQNKRMTDLKLQNDKKTLELNQMVKQMRFKDELVQEVIGKKNSDSIIILQYNNVIKDLRASNEEKNKQIQQLNLILSNTNLLFDTEKLEHQHTSISLAASLTENGKLHGTIQQQMKDLNILLYEKRTKGISSSEAEAEYAIANRKVEEKAKQIRELNKKIQDLQEQSRKSVVNAESEKKLRIQIQQNLQVCYQNMKEMKNAKNMVDEQLQYKIKRMQSVEKIIEQKQGLIAKQKQEIEYYRNEKNSLKILNESLNSKYEIEVEKLKSMEDIFRLKCNSLKQEKSQFQQLAMEAQELKQKFEQQLQQATQKLSEVEQSLKDERFERGTLNVFYQSSLNVGSQKTDEIKNLDIRISELTQQVSTLKRKLKNALFILQEKEKQFQKQVTGYNQKLESVIKQSRRIKQYIHPMIFQDVAANYAIMNDKYENCKKIAAKEAKQLKGTVQFQQSLLKSTKIEQKGKIEQLQTKYKTEMVEKQAQIASKQNRINQLEHKTKKLSQHLSLYAGSSSYEQRQRIQEKQISQKLEQIKKLKKQVESITQTHKELKQNYGVVQQIMNDKKDQVEVMKKTLVQDRKFYENKLENKQKEMKDRIQYIHDQYKGNINESSTKQFARIGTTDKKSKGEGSGRVHSGNKKEKSIQKTGETLYETLQNNRNKQSRQHSSEQIGDQKRIDFARKYRGATVYYNK